MRVDNAVSEGNPLKDNWLIEAMYSKQDVQFSIKIIK
jgi:hypothetical protein